MNRWRNLLILSFYLLFAGIGWVRPNLAQSPNSQIAPPPAADHWLSHSSARFPKNRDPNTVYPARFPVVDVHTHFFVKARHDEQVLQSYVSMMDRNGIAISTSLDGTLGPKLEAHRDFLWSQFKQRFVIFANIDFRGAAQENDYAKWECNQPYFVRHVVEQLRTAKSQGIISGLKFFKDFGLQYRDSSGKLLAIDDERWEPIWKCCGELGIPVIMHTADPSAFFRPADTKNERLRELEVHPDWSFLGPQFPSRAELHAARNRVIERNPTTLFIGAHFANDAEDLEELERWLAQYPNLYIEFASRINELGRQPYSARDFFIQHQDRILFGTDGPWPEARLQLYWRFLESKDEYFPYSDKVPPPQGDWNIYGIHLPDDVLQKVYNENASKIIPGVRERLEHWKRSRMEEEKEDK